MGILLATGQHLDRRGSMRKVHRGTWDRQKEHDGGIYSFELIRRLEKAFRIVYAAMEL